MKNLKQEALKYHSNYPAGKFEITPTKPFNSAYYLSLAYSPAVAYPSEEIAKDSSLSYEYTAKKNLVGVISNGTAVLGLGNIGALASKPVMEGKAMLFKIMAGIDAFDIEVDETNIEKFVDTVAAISPTFGAINLEDIKAPECFEIEKQLRERLNIPVMHDDQHGTAIIASAALLNALKLNSKKIEEIKIVASGAGAAAMATLRKFLRIGVKRENIVLCDSKGVVRKGHTSGYKEEFATVRELSTLSEALVGADMFLGLSVANILTKEMLCSMASDPIVFALANPNPEVDYQTAISSRDDIIFATGRSDLPNQINNVLGFPYIFRGALDTASTKITEGMKLAAVYAIAELTHREVPCEVSAAYNNEQFSFSRGYIIPKPLDPRLIEEVSLAVARAAMEDGVALKPIEDFEEYRSYLRGRRSEVLCLQCIRLGNSGNNGEL